MLRRTCRDEISEPRRVVCSRVQYIEIPDGFMFPSCALGGDMVSQFKSIDKVLSDAASL
jgi:hypothetical protein